MTQHQHFGQSFSESKQNIKGSTFVNCWATSKDDSYLSVIFCQIFVGLHLSYLFFFQLTTVYQYVILCLTSVAMVLNGWCYVIIHFQSMNYPMFFFSFLRDEYFGMKAQWKTITSEQERRFSLFKERKNLIGQFISNFFFILGRLNDIKSLYHIFYCKVSLHIFFLCFIGHGSEISTLIQSSLKLFGQNSACMPINTSLLYP